MDEVFCVACFSNYLARGAVHLPARNWAVANKRLSHESDGLVTRPRNDVKNPGILFGHLLAQVAHPGNVVVDAAGLLQLAPHVEQQKISSTNECGSFPARLVVRVACVRT